MHWFVRACFIGILLFHVLVLGPLINGVAKEQIRYIKIGFLCAPPALFNIHLVQTHIRHPVIRVLATLAVDITLLLLADRIVV